jgi:hypothetical protein
MRGRGRFGWGGPGWGGFGGGFGRGFGRGNPYPFCRFYPWLPRQWWAMPYASQYAATIPYTGYGYPYSGPGRYPTGSYYPTPGGYPLW